MMRVLSVLIICGLVFGAGLHVYAQDQNTLKETAIEAPKGMSFKSAVMFYLGVSAYREHHCGSDTRWKAELNRKLEGLDKKTYAARLKAFETGWAAAKKHAKRFRIDCRLMKKYLQQQQPKTK